MEFETFSSNGIDLHCAVAGTGPLVLLLHGFPESWYSWRHQIPALAEAGYRVVAPDMRGYGKSSRPTEIEAYDIRQLTADMVGLIDVGGAEQAVVVGHDWGAAVAWHCALLQPSRFRAVASLSVPYRPRSKSAPIARLKENFGERFFYQLYFQQPGRAEAELEADIPAFLRKFFYVASGDTPPQPKLMEKTKDDLMLTDLIDPDPLPDWLSAEDLAFYAGEFTPNGLTAPLNWYRNIDRNWQITADLNDYHIHQPALFIAGERDPVLYFTDNAVDTMRGLVDDLKDCIILPGCGHWTQQERPQAVTQALLTFLRGVS